MRRRPFHAVALPGAAAFLLLGCVHATAPEPPAEAPEYTHHPVTGEKHLRYVPIGRNEFGCMQYRVEGVDPDTIAHTALVTWNGERFVFDMAGCRLEPDDPAP